MEWSEFAQRLGRELAGLERDTILIVREREESRHYVQAMREPDRLYAEAVGNHFLEGPLLLTPADEEVMSEAGWQPPAEPAPRNWWTELPPFATTVDNARLAEMMVTALRDVQGVRRPSDLVYESFHRLGTGLIELLDFGIASSDPARISERRSAAAIVAAAAPEPAAAGSVPLAAPVPFQEPPQPTQRGLQAANGVAPGKHHSRPAHDGAGGDGELEERLADAKQRGDHVTYFDLLLRAELVLPATGNAVQNPGAEEYSTTTINGTTYVMVFSSPQALAQSARRPAPGGPPLHRKTTFARLAAVWPDPAWSLAINAGLPSEVHLDATAVARLESTRQAAEQAAAVDAVSSPAPPATPVSPPAATPVSSPAAAAPQAQVPAPALPVDEPAPQPPPSTPIMLPHGVQLWRDDGDGADPAPVAVYDAIGGGWTRIGVRGAEEAGPPRR